MTRPQSGPAAGSVAGRIGTFAQPQRRDFRLLLLGTTLSNAAQWIQQVTLGWLVYDLTGSGAMLGAIKLVRAAATLGLAPACADYFAHPRSISSTRSAYRR